MHVAGLAAATAVAAAAFAAAQMPPAPRLRSVEAQLKVSGCTLSVAETYSFSSWSASERFVRDLPYTADQLSAVAIAFPGASEDAAEVASLVDDFWKTR